MKKTLIAMLVLLMAASAFAVNPVGKGMLYMDGAWTGNFAIRGGDLNKGGSEDSPTYLQLDPSLGYFLADGLAIGVTLKFANFTWGDYKETTFGAGPRVIWFPTAKNADEPKGKILPFLSGSFIYQSMKVEDPGSTPELAKLAAANATDDTKISGYAARFSGGGVWMLSGVWGVHGEAYFELQNAKTTYTPAVGPEVEGDGISGNEFGIMLGVIAFFGSAK
ncbi:MAG: hypothetical protein WBP29_02920 [Candidatus Zixiibacteriota bacterium]